MSLKAFHVVFIAISTLLAFGFAAWSYLVYLSKHEGHYLIVMILSLLFGAALIAYGNWFLKKLKAGIGGSRTF